MKNKTINFSWPAIMSDFKQDGSNEQFSRGKLKVFYKGETADHRYFSDEFAENVIKTLPYTPVVSNYDEEKEDFIGHANEQQIFGIVDPCIEPYFETDEEGKEWCVCEVVLYTERPDKVGKFAQKIIGQPHSLELNPKTVEYVINYDEKKHFKNIEFTAGHFVGVSVLGKKQKPAFTGSAFFNCDEVFETRMQILKNYCEGVSEQSHNGGEEMNLEEFMKLSWGDITEKVVAAVRKDYENDAWAYMVDMYEDSVIMRLYYYIDGSNKLVRINYTCEENGDILLGDVKEVHIVYEDIEPVEPTSEINMQQVEEVEETTENFEEVKEVKEIEETTENFEETEEATTDVASDEKSVNATEPIEENQTSFDDTINTDATQVSNVEITPDNTMEASVENEQNSTIEEENTSSTSFTESEREEFEILKREKKVGLVDSYKDSLTEEEYNSFMENIDSFDFKDLELEVLKAYKRNQENVQEKPIRAFAFAPINANNNNNESILDSFVRKNKR